MITLIQIDDITDSRISDITISNLLMSIIQSVTVVNY